jgi:hypothetical protein
MRVYNMSNKTVTFSDKNAPDLGLSDEKNGLCTVINPPPPKYKYKEEDSINIKITQNAWVPKHKKK